MLRVLLVRPHNQGKGGVANYYRAVEPYLDDHEIRIFAFEIGSFKKKFLNFHPVIDQLRFFRKIKIPFDLVHVNPSLGWKSFFRDGLFIWQAKRRGLKVLVFFRGWDIKFAVIVDRYFRWFFRITFARADKFIVLASDFERQLRHWGVNQPIELGTTLVDDRLLRNFNCQNKLLRLRQTRQIKILYLARLEKDKGVYEVIDAVRLLVIKGLDVSLAIAGDGALLSDLRVYIDSLGLSNECITLLGYVTGDAKIKIFSDSDIYCLPSYYGEGLPNSVLEAMAFAMPVITTSVGGLADFFQDGRMGYIVQPKNSEEIACAVESLINDREKMVKIAEYNHEYACAHLLAPKVASFLKNNYKLVIES